MPPSTWRRWYLHSVSRGRYAGRFAIGMGNDSPQLEGSYTVREKMIGPTYYGREGTIESNDPNNPLGKHWIGLDNRIGIHGTQQPGQRRHGKRPRSDLPRGSATSRMFSTSSRSAPEW